MEPKVSYIPWPEAVATTAIAISTALMILASSYERISVANQYKAGTLAYTGTLICREPDRLIGLWLVRTILGLIAVLLPIPGMWFNFYQEQSNGMKSTASSWAAGSLVCCICSSILYEVCLPAVRSQLCRANVYLTASTICRVGPRHHRVAGRGSGGINIQYDRLKPRRIRDTWRAAALVDSGMLLCLPRIDDSMVDRSGDAAKCEFRITPTCMYGTHRTHHRH